jgi:hypothetical protein
MKHTKDDIVTLSKFDFEEVLVYAGRYAIGRMTYAPHSVCGIINTQLPYLSDNTLKILRDDIAREIERDNLGSTTIDAPVWKQTYNNITEELSKRTIKK